MEIKARYYDFTKKEDKHFFAGLLNTAVNNFNLSLQELSKRINIPVSNDFIKRAFSGEISPSDLDLRIEYLSESLVFLKRLKKKDDIVHGKVYEVLSNLYETVSSLRHFYTHYQHQNYTIPENVVNFLNETLLDAVLNVKRRVKSEEYKKHLFEKYHDEFENTFDEANKKKGRKHKVKPDEKLSFVINKPFSKYILIEGENIKLKKAVGCSNGNGGLTRNGFILLMSLFLNKKQMETLFAYTKYFKDTQKLEFQITRWVFSYYSYRDIRKLFRSDYSNDALVLQMIEELSKCPAELYPYLSDDDKSEFIEDLNIYYKDNPEFSDVSEDGIVEHEVIRKRYEDKFPYFAIRFLDEIAGFPNLRFSVNMGRFNHNTKKKELSGVNFNKERSILERITVFERLSEATKKKAVYFEDINGKNALTDNEWIEFPAPHYQFAGNNIGIWLNMDGFGDSRAQKKRKGEKLSKYDILIKMGLHDKLKSPVAYLSFNELPSLLYQFLIKKKKPVEIERVLRNKIYEQRNLVYKYQSGDEYKKKIIPKKIRKIVENPEANIDWKKLRKDIEKEVKKDPVSEIRKYYKNKRKINPEQFTNTEKGKIAAWLSADIKRFVNKEIREKIKGYQYAEFQALLSYYDFRKNEVKSFMAGELKIVKEVFPFDIAACFEKKTLFGFYNVYLKNRKDYLNSLLSLADRRTVDEKLFNGFNEKLYVIPLLSVYKDNILEMPVNLPRGLFDDKPTAFDKKKSETPSLADWFVLSGNTDNAQKFYKFTRIYKYNCDLKNENCSEQKLNPEKGIKKQYNNNLPVEEQKRIYNNEKQIRKIMRQDYFIFEMAKYNLLRLDNISSDIENIQLKDVFLTKVEKDEIRQRAANMEINDDHILLKRVSVSVLGERIKDDVALKSVGKFRKLSQDKRVQALVSYFPDKIWSYRKIADELEKYDVVRAELIFKAVHLLEKKIYEKAEKNNDIQELLRNRNPNFRNYISYYFIDNKPEREEFKKINLNSVSISDLVNEKWKSLYLLAKIRNKFSHNQLIPIEDFRFLTEKFTLKEDEQVSLFLYRAFCDLAGIAPEL